jgi:hypothetical protein
MPVFFFFFFCFNLPNPSDPGVYPVSNRNEYQKQKNNISWGVERGRCVGLRTLPPSVSRLSRNMPLLPVMVIALLCFSSIESFISGPTVRHWTTWCAERFRRLSYCNIWEFGPLKWSNQRRCMGSGPKAELRLHQTTSEVLTTIPQCSVEIITVF